MCFIYYSATFSEKAGDLDTLFQESGREPESSVKWMFHLCDVETLHGIWLVGCEGVWEKINSKYLGFEIALRTLRKNITDREESTAHILSPFIVKTHIKCRTAQRWKDYTRVA